VTGADDEQMSTGSITEAPVTRGRRNETSGGGLAWLVLLLGLAVTGFGVAYGVAAGRQGALSARDTVIAAVVGSLGSGIVGAAMSILISRAADRRKRADIAALITETLTARFTSDPDGAAAARADWYEYHVTAIDGRYVWRHARFRLDRSTEVNAARARLTVLDEIGREFHYVAEAGVRGTDGVFLLSQLDGGLGAAVIHIIPDLTRAHQTIFCGIGLYEDWHGKKVLGSVILSRKPLAAVGAKGVVKSAHFEELNRQWRAGFLGQEAILPTVQP
jgi:hypothetical protein